MSWMKTSSNGKQISFKINCTFAFSIKFLGSSSPLLNRSLQLGQLLSPCLSCLATNNISSNHGNGSQQCSMQIYQTLFFIPAEDVVV